MSVTLTDKIIFLAFAISRVSSERIQVVTPENVGVAKDIGTERNSTQYDDDSYIKAYREIINAAERRSPTSDYVEESSYNTLAHSSYLDHHIYPKLNENSHSHTNFHRDHPPVIYGPPSPVSHYSHYHHYPHPEEHSSSHHVIPILSPYHFVISFLGKFGLKKIFNLIAKIVVLKVILKFVAIIALFLVLPSLVSNKDKETDDDRFLNDVTTWVWNGITENENDKEEEEEEEEMEGESGSGSDDHHEKPEKEKEMNEPNQKLLNKIIKDWKDENFGGPGKEAAVKFLTQFLDIINRILGALLGYVKMKNNNMDELDSIMIDKFSLYTKQLARIWPNMHELANLAG